MRTRLAAGNRLRAYCDRLYRLLLFLYPGAFRREYGPHMAQVFRDCCREAQAAHGAIGVLGIWVPTLRDLTASALTERLTEEHHMPHLSRSTLVRAGGAAALLGGIFNLLSFLSHPSGPARAIVPGSIVLLIIGVLGLHARLWGREGRLGLLGLVLVGVGLLLGLIGMAGSAVGVLDPNPVARVINTGEHAGLVFIGAGMLVWGIVALREKALGRLSALPLLIGLLSLTGIAFLNPDAFAAVEHSVMPLVYAASWILLGYALLTSQRDASPALPPSIAL